MSGVDDLSFRIAVRRRSHLFDVLLLALVPAALVGVHQLPRSTRVDFVFETAAPTVLTAYTAHFVHLDSFHMVGNLAVYLLVAPLAYLLCVIASRRALFLGTFVTLLFVFPFALSGMQLIFPRERIVFGFSGINAGFFGLLGVALLGYANRMLSSRFELEYAPALLFLSVGVIARLSLPARAWRLEIAAGSIVVGIGYLLVVLRRMGLPSLAAVRSGLDRPGYIELAGAGFGAAAVYPYIGFQDVVFPGETVLDVYVHLLGYCLAFIAVYLFLLVTEES